MYINIAVHWRWFMLRMEVKRIKIYIVEGSWNLFWIPFNFINYPFLIYFDLHSAFFIDFCIHIFSIIPIPVPIYVCIPLVIGILIACLFKIFCSYTNHMDKPQMKDYMISEYPIFSCDFLLYLIFNSSIFLFHPKFLSTLPKVF